MNHLDMDVKVTGPSNGVASATRVLGIARRAFDDLRRNGLPPAAKPHRPSVWAIALWLSLVDALWALQAGFRVTLASFVGCTVPVVLMVGPLLFRKLRARVRLRETLSTIGGLMVFAPACLLLSYLVVAMAPPMMDARLAGLDGALGFRWVPVAQWVKTHALVGQVFWWAYRSAALQIIVLVIVLGATGRHRQLREFNALFMIGGIFCTLFSAITPAYGPWHAAPAGLFDTRMVSHFDPLRSGALRLIDLGAMQGLISMPSFHTMGAVFFAYAMRGIHGWAPLFSILNLLMVASTPTEGGHYLVDVVAGCGFALAMIALSRSDFLSAKDDFHGHAGVSAR